MPKIELKPCPFCASKEIEITVMYSGTRTFIMCCNCGADIDSTNCDEDVVTLWNTRPNND